MKDLNLRRTFFGFPFFIYGQFIKVERMEDFFVELFLFAMELAFDLRITSGRF